MSARSATFHFLLGISSVHHALCRGTEVFAPPSHGLSRYEAIWQRSPFIRETPPVPRPGLESRYGLVGIASLGADPVAFLVDRSEPDPARSRFMISAKRPGSPHGLELVEITCDPLPRQSSVRVRQDGKEAVLPWDPAMRNALPEGKRWSE
jgi:hypothetical protein